MFYGATSAGILASTRGRRAPTTLARATASPHGSLPYRIRSAHMTRFLRLSALHRLVRAFWLTGLVLAQAIVPQPAAAAQSQPQPKSRQPVVLDRIVAVVNDE